MFELAELGRTLDKKAYDERVPQLRENLLDAQIRVKEARGFSVIIVVAGAEGAGKGEAVNCMLDWLDARGVTTHAMGLPSSEEVERPHLYKFWRRLPPRGSIAIFFGSWYTDPIVQHASGDIHDAELDAKLTKIVEFERMLTHENTLLLKFWFHVSKDYQRRRFKHLESNPDTAWRVTKRDWKFHRTYDEFITTSTRAIRQTSTDFAPWQIIEAHDHRYRDVTMAEQILHSMGQQLDVKPSDAPPEDRVISPPQFDTTILRTLDLSAKLARDDYEKQLEAYQGRLGRLARRMADEKCSVVLVFEGPDAAGKGSAIRRIVHALDARYYRVTSVAAPTDEEAARPYLWRFWRQLPGQGHFTLFDRSWYGRVLVERVEKFCSEHDWRRAYSEINFFEEQLVEAGVIVVKYWLAIGQDEQLSRFKQREATGYKRHKLTDEDWRNRDKWGDYEIAASEMIGRTSTELAPWTLVEAEDKLFARIKVLKTLCDRLEEVVGPDKLTKR